MINVLVSSLSRDFGGVESLFLTICQNCKEYNVHFDFLCSDVCAAREEDFKATGAKIYHLPRAGKNLEIYKKNFNAILENGDYQIFHVNMTRYKFPLELVLAKSHGLRVILHSHSTQIYKTNNQKTDCIRKIEQILFRPIALKNSDLNIACCRTAGEYLFQKNKYSILYNGIVLNKYLFSSEERAKARKQFGIAPEAKVIGHIGRFSDEKNHEYLLNIFKNIYEKGTRQICLLCVGNGMLYEQIKERARQLGIENVVFFAGQRKDISSLLSAMDVFVFPSKHEAFPMTLIEAQTNGLPCVVSECVTKEIVVGDKIQFLKLDPTTIEWEQTIERILEAKNMDRKICKDELEKFDVLAMIKKLYIMYEKELRNASK